MIVEVLAVGTELLLGQIVNGNGAYLGARLAEHGFDAHYQVVVGDNVERIAAVIKTSLARSDALIITGGIGPTQDDLTREALCLATSRRLVHSEAWAATLLDRWTAAGRVMPESNLRQAEYPESAELLGNEKGTAPGLFLRHNGKAIFVVPGVPEEMHALFDGPVLERLAALAGQSNVLVNRVLRTWGIPESKVGEMLDDLYRASTNPSIAFLASAAEIKVRITAKAADQAAARSLIAPVELAVRERLGSAVFGIDQETVESVLLAALAARGWTLGTAESATGGLVAGRITSVPGSSAVYRGSLIAYTSDLKQRLLHVDPTAGVVTESVALAMAEGARSLLAVDVAVAVTGSAGPEPAEQSVGTMIVGVATPEASRARTIRFPGDRERVRTYASTAALHLCRLAVAGEWWATP